MDKDDIFLSLVILLGIVVCIGGGVWFGEWYGSIKERKLLTPYFKQELNNAYWDGYEDGKKLCQ